MNHHIKNIIFDWGGVLVDIDLKGCMHEFEKLGMTDVENKLIQFKDNMLAYESGRITTADFRQQIRDIIGKPLTNEAIDRAWISMLKTIPEYKLELLLKLNRQYKVYLLSNTNSLHWEYGSAHLFNYKGKGVEDMFRQVFLSHEMHCAKPSAEIFTKALAAASIHAEETLFIDDLQANCDAACSVGIDGQLYVPGTDLKELCLKILS